MRTTLWIERAKGTMSKPIDQNRFLLLVDEHKKILFKVAHLYCRNPHSRDDLIQEMILQLWRSFHRYDERFRFSTWMYRVALNVAISFYRSETRTSHKAVSLGDSILEVATPSAELSEWEDDLRLLQKFIDQLNELDRALLLLYLDGNSYSTIAEILGISETNVGTKINRIKQRIRRDWNTHLPKE
jgi:RNA polymerase sigma factor (sigma-70 family)